MFVFFVAQMAELEESVCLWSRKFGLDSESDQTNDFKVGIRFIKLASLSWLTLSIKKTVQKTNRQVRL